MGTGADGENEQDELIRHEEDIMKRVTLFVAVLTLAVAVPLSSQASPNFSGAWTFGTIEPQNNAGGMAGWGAAEKGVVIKQSANEVVVERSAKRHVYKLDGSTAWFDIPDPTNKEPGGPYSFKTRARWDGAQLVLFTRQGLNQMREILTLDGGKLTILRDLEAPPGSRTSTLVFTKTP
jgi:hypothetical protein